MFQEWSLHYPQSLWSTGIEYILRNCIFKKLPGEAADGTQSLHFDSIALLAHTIYYYLLCISVAQVHAKYLLKSQVLESTT